MIVYTLETKKREMAMRMRFHPIHLAKCLRENNDPLEAIKIDLLHLKCRLTINTKCAVLLHVTKGVSWCHKKS